MSGWSVDAGRADAAHSPLRALVAGFPGAAAHVSGSHIWFNAFTEEIVGYRAEELATLDAWGIAVHGANEPEALEVYQKARAAGFPSPEVLTVVRKDGTPRLVEFSAYLGDCEEVWVMRDITETHRAQQELHDREQRLRIAVTTAGLGTWEWDVAAGHITGDHVARHMFGFTDEMRSEPLGVFLERVVPDDQPALERAMTSAAGTGLPLDVEFRVRAGHGRERWLRMHGTSVGDGSTGRLIGAVRDIDSYKRMDERLVHAAQMESLGHLAGGVAHDFNNLLAVIQGQVEFVKMDPGVSEKATVRLRSIERAVSKGADMVSTLMQLGHKDSSPAAVVDVNELLTATADSLEHVVGEDVTVELHLDAASPCVRFDESRLSAIVLNLATNARDAMPVGGLLSITTRNAPPVDHPGGDTDETWLQLIVEDTGTGMDAETRSRIFEPFFTTKSPGVGTGLGLASVYDAVMDAAGIIDVETAPGAGTTFSISLPCVASATAASPTAPSPFGTRSGQGQLIMVVEDDPDILDITADTLRAAGYRVVEALGSKIALELVDGGEVPDLLLTDVVMPDLSGPRLAGVLGDRIPGLRVLFMSGYTSAGHGEVPMDDARLIRKPFSHEHLLERIAALLPRRG